VIPSLLKKRPTGPGWVCKSKGHLITTQHLVLRAPKAGDQEAIRATLDDEVVYWQGFAEEDELLDAEAKRLAQGKLRKRPFAEWWLVCEKPSGEVIGAISICDLENEYTRCHIGLWLKEGWRGRGLGAEAIASVISVLSHIGFETAVAGTRTDNEKAIKLFTKFGFRRTTTKPHTLPNGYVVPSLWLELEIPKSSKAHCDLR
jgi:RimJ/RimL family protein N-acetyltransferase